MKKKSSQIRDDDRMALFIEIMDLIFAIFAWGLVIMILNIIIWLFPKNDQQISQYFVTSASIIIPIWFNKKMTKRNIKISTKYIINTLGLVLGIIIIFGILLSIVLLVIVWLQKNV